MLCHCLIPVALCCVNEVPVDIDGSQPLAVGALEDARVVTEELEGCNGREGLLDVDAPLVGFVVLATAILEVEDSASVNASRTIEV